MNIVTTKYAIGDTVYSAGTMIVQKKHDCPDCLGERKWSVESPAGAKYSFSCPRCSSSFQSNRKLSLNYSHHEPRIERLTIGSIRTDTYEGLKVEYMCRETGVGSGSIYREENLFSTQEEALICAEEKAAEANASVNWIVEQYKETLELSDYQMDAAREFSAEREAQDKYQKVRYFVADIVDCDSIDEVKQLIEKHFPQ